MKGEIMMHCWGRYVCLSCKMCCAEGISLPGCLDAFALF